MGRSITIEDAKRCYALIEQCTELWADVDAWQNHLSSGAQALIGGCTSVMGASRVAADGSVEIADASIAPGADATLAASFDRYVADGGFGLLPELPVITPLTLDALLDGIGEKEIAHRLGIGRPTAHEYVMSIYAASACAAGPS